MKIRVFIFNNYEVALFLNQKQLHNGTFKKIQKILFEEGYKWSWNSGPRIYKYNDLVNHHYENIVLYVNYNQPFYNNGEYKKSLSWDRYSEFKRRGIYNKKTMLIDINEVVSRVINKLDLLIKLKQI